jgi:hypothetical protein
MRQRIIQIKVLISFPFLVDPVAVGPCDFSHPFIDIGVDSPATRSRFLSLFDQ